MYLLDLYNAICSLMIGLFAGVCIMSPRVRDGIIIKMGLACISVAHLALFVLYLDHPVSYLPFSAARGLVHTGGLLMLVGYYVSTVRAGRSLRRASDWVSLEQHGRSYGHDA